MSDDTATQQALDEDSGEDENYPEFTVGLRQALDEVDIEDVKVRRCELFWGAGGDLTFRIYPAGADEPLVGAVTGPAAG